MSWWSRAALRFAVLVGSGSVLAGLAGLAHWRFSGDVSPVVAAGGSLLVVTGLAAAGCALVLGRIREEALRLRRETDVLRAERNAQSAKVERLERRTERLSLVREIHRCTNIVTRGERLRQILSVIGQLGEKVEAALFAAGAPGAPGAAPGGLRPAAYLRSFEEGELFLRVDGMAASGGELAVAGAALATNGLGREIAGDLVCAGELVGRIEVSAAPVDDGTAPEEALTRLLSGADLDCEPAARALEQGQILRSHDSATGLIELVYPLIAEGAGVGALRVRLPAAEFGSQGSRDSLRELEDALAECTRHVALALKKETDADRAITDGLTRLLIRREFEPRLDEALDSAVEEKSPLALLMIDIDHFKAVNDTHGHQSGDSVLRGVAGVIRRHIRACDSAYRYGGEEMCVVLPGSGSREAKATAERLRSAVEETSFGGATGQNISVTISVGLTAIDPRRSRAKTAKAARKRRVNHAKLIGRADAAVYRAKEEGRNRVVVWNRRMKPRKTATSVAKKPSRKKSRKGRTGSGASRPTTRRSTGRSTGSASSSARPRKKAA